MPKQIKVAFVTSGTGATLGVLLRACRNHFISADVIQVVTDRLCPAVDVAIAAGVEVVNLEAPRDMSSAAVSERLAEILDPVTPDLLCLAYNRIVTSPVTTQYKDRIVNMHPSLLPAFKGFKAVPDCLERGLFAGATVHICTDDIDGGPLIVQSALPIGPEEEESKVRERIYNAQIRNLLQTVQWFAEGRVVVVGHRAVVQGARYGDGMTNPRYELDFQAFFA